MSINDSRVSRNPNLVPDYSRDDTVKAALDALFEEDTGAGFSEIAYVNNVFVDTIETYTSPAKTELRTRTTFSYSPLPFVNQVVKEFFKEGSLTAYKTITATFTYNANKTVNTINIGVT